MKNKAATPEPMPKKGGVEVLPAVIEDLKARSEMGREKYGTTLYTDNGRDALNDAYQEALDLCMYLKQAIIERDEAFGPAPGSFIYCHNCGERKSVDAVEFLNIQEDVYGVDLMTFRCPDCGAVRESNIYFAK